MNNYTVSLFLLYIKDMGNDYDLSEVKQILGITQHQLEYIMKDLIKQELIEYVNFTLKITHKGLRYLISKNNINFHIQDDEYITNIKRHEVLPVDAPYIPKNFDRKYNTNNN